MSDLLIAYLATLVFIDTLVFIIGVMRLCRTESKTFFKLVVEFFKNIRIEFSTHSGASESEKPPIENNDDTYLELPHNEHNTDEHK